MRPVLDWIFIIGSGVGVPLLFAVVAFLRRKPHAVNRSGIRHNSGHGMTPGPVAPSAPRMKTQPPTQEREVSRRVGKAVSVTIECFTGKIDGWVVDRSPRGIGIQTKCALTPGDVIKVRPTKAGPFITFEKAEVCDCTPIDDDFHVSCEFVRTPGNDFMILLG
jgi:hypothetical protein